MKKLQRKKGFSLAETLIVIAIIAVLSALIVIAVFAYLRSLTKLEYDGYAKEIFIASQNHLSMAESQGYLGRTDDGYQFDDSEKKDGIYYFVKDGSHYDVNNEDTFLNLMLPFAAVDDTVRMNGCYVIRYHRDSATVLDVFYWQETGRFSHTYEDADYAKFLAKRPEKSELRTYDDRSVIGWYGGEDAKTLTHGEEIQTPVLTVTNADQLKAVITDNNLSNDKVQLKLIITGLTSRNKQELPITRTSTGTYEIILDDITDDKHFDKLFCGPGQSDPLIPGEDITLQVVAYNNTELTNVAYSPVVTTNSLFAYNDTDDGSAHISHIRHLENLDPVISNLDTSNEELKHVTGSGVSAKQTTDLTWSSSTGSYPRITNAAGGQLTDQLFKPIDTRPYSSDGTKPKPLTYDGQSYSINNVKVSTSGTEDGAGLFANLKQGDTIQHLKLADSDVSGGNAGALAGSATGATVTDVVVCNSSNDSATTATIKGGSNAGGLIGTATNCTITRSAAAVVVESSGNAGGLIGSSTGGSISASYSGGHTEQGSYKDVTYIDANDGNKEKIKYNVTGATNAGGLIGQAAGTAVTSSYSTCSASGGVAGGLIGDASGLTVSKSYSTGLIDGTSNAGALIGKLDSTDLENCLTDCKYYDIINERFKNGTDGKAGFTYLAPVGDQNTDSLGGGVSAFDQNAGTYQDFVGPADGWKSAVAYDLNLSYYYQGRYNLQTVDQLSGTAPDDLASKHYGDWPAPEIWVINESNG